MADDGLAAPPVRVAACQVQRRVRFRYAQAISEAGHTPSGDTAQDERAAIGLLTAMTPLGVPWIEPENVAPVVVFLASDQARMVSGTSFAATGGDSAHVTA